MKKTLILVLCGIVAMGLLATDSISAQQSANSTSQDQKRTAKACILVFGAVRSPARIDFQNIRLREAIQMAGGATESASGAIQVIRSSSALTCPPPEGPGTVPAVSDSRVPSPHRASMDFYTLSELRTENVEGNPQLQPGDVVVVVEAPPMYVVGQVKVPQVLYLKGHMTLTQAIARVGGILRDSNPRKVRILRSKGQNSIREVIIIDLKGIRKHRMEDPLLQPYDIIEVPGRQGGYTIDRIFDAHPLRLKEIT